MVGKGKCESAGVGSGKTSAHSHPPLSSEAWAPAAVARALAGGGGGRRRMGAKPRETNFAMTPSAAQGQKMRRLLHDSADTILSTC